MPQPWQAGAAPGDRFTKRRVRHRQRRLRALLLALVLGAAASIAVSAQTISG